MARNGVTPTGDMLYELVRAMTGSPERAADALAEHEARRMAAGLPPE